MHVTGAPDIGLLNEMPSPLEEMRMGHPDHEMMVFMPTLCPVMPPTVEGHVGAGKRVGRGSGVAEGMQPKPVQPDREGQVSAVDP